jgi:FdhE protein
MIRPSWDRRIRRAEELAKKYPFAAEILEFYRGIACFQQDLHAQFASTHGAGVRRSDGGFLREELDVDCLLPTFSSLLALVQKIGSPSLARSAHELSAHGRHAWKNLLGAYLTSGGNGQTPEDSEIFFARAFLQPYAEFLAAKEAPPAGDYRWPVCPVCRGKPQVGVLRPEGDGAKRSLICSICSNEWDYRRIVCPACEEEDEKKLAVYLANDFDYVRVETCETCKTYIKTVDLTKNGLAVPVVDELATIPLNLWAQENGYAKLQTNLLGI